MFFIQSLRATNFSFRQTFPRLITAQKPSLQAQFLDYPRFQSRFRPVSTSAMDSKIDEIISYWLDKGSEAWFFPPPGMDDEIRTKFSDYIEKARSTEIDHWAETPQGVLALILLLDQFPRNIFRGSSESFSSDHKALSITTTAIAKRFDRELGKERRFAQMFLYLPLMHAEDLRSQIACVAMFENLAASCEVGTVEKEIISKGIELAQRHSDCILRLGRFPKRNEAVGRESTAEEQKFLEENPAGF